MKTHIHNFFQYCLSAVNRIKSKIHIKESSNVAVQIGLNDFMIKVKKNAYRLH